MESNVCWAICLLSIYCCIFLISHSPNHKKDSEKQYVQEFLHNLSDQPLLQLLYLHVPLADHLGDAYKIVVLEVEKGVWGRWVDQLVVDISKVLVPAGLFRPSVLQRGLSHWQSQENTDLKVSIDDKVQPHTLDSWCRNSSFSNSNSILG